MAFLRDIKKLIRMTIPVSDTAPINGGRGGDMIASTWPRFRARLEDRGKSRRTIGAFKTTRMPSPAQ
jgi:hypothetical protein